MPSENLCKTKMQTIAKLKLIHKRKLICPSFAQKIAQRQGNRKMMKANQIIVLTMERAWAHLAESAGRKESDVMSELVAYVDGGCLGNPGRRALEW